MLKKNTFMNILSKILRYVSRIDRCEIAVRT